MQKKETFFARYFDIIDISSSVARMRKRQQRKTYKEEKKPEASGETSYRIEVKDPKWVVPAPT